jgi:hypothetical protein
MSFIDGMPQVDKLNKFIFCQISCNIRSFTDPLDVAYTPHSARLTGRMGNFLRKRKAETFIE